MNTAVCDPLIKSYFDRLESCIADLPEAQRQDFVKELRAHVTERLEQMATPTDENCRAVLGALGTPDEIARQLRMEMILKRSSWRISPVAILRTCARWTVAGVQGYVVFLAAAVGYLFAATFCLTALLKPIFPHNVGLFVSNHSIELTRFPVPPHGHEILGSYYIPLALLIGYLSAVATNALIRYVIHRGRSLRQRLA